MKTDGTGIGIPFIKYFKPTLYPLTHPSYLCYKLNLASLKHPQHKNIKQMYIPNSLKRFYNTFDIMNSYKIS